MLYAVALWLFVCFFLSLLELRYLLKTVGLKMTVEGTVLLAQEL